MKAVHCWVASISEFCLETNHLTDEMVRQNTVATDQNANVINDCSSVFSLAHEQFGKDTLM
jgi:hypothetical protein